MSDIQTPPTEQPRFPGTGQHLMAPTPTGSAQMLGTTPQAPVTTTASPANPRPKYRIGKVSGGTGGKGGPGKRGGGGGGTGTGPVFGLTDEVFMEADEVSGGTGGEGGKSDEGKGGKAGDGTGPEFK